MNEDPFAEYRIPKEPTGLPGTSPPDPFAAYRVNPGGEAAVTKPLIPPLAEPVLSDKYAQAAIEERDRMAAAGKYFNPVGPQAENAFLGAPGRLISGGTVMNWADPLSAAANAAIDVGTGRRSNYNEAYAYAKAYQDLLSKRAEQATGPLAGLALSSLGAVTTGAGAMGPATRLASPAANYFKNVGGSTVLGSIGGAGAAPTSADIPEYAGLGAGLGAITGIATPVIPHMLQPFTGRMRSADEAATSFIANKARMAGVTPQQLVQEITDAQTAGQPYTVADVFGRQSGISTYAKTPGEQQRLVIDALRERSQNRPYRFQDIFGEGMGVQQTAKAAEESLKKKAQTEAAPFFEQAKQTPTWSTTLDKFIEHPDVRKGIAEGVRQEVRRTVGTGKPFNVTDVIDLVHDAQGNPIVQGVRPNLQTIQVAKIGLDNEIGAKLNASNGQVTSEIQSLIALKNNMLAEVYKLNPAYQEANRIYAGPMQVRDAITTGREAMLPGSRYQDTIPAFRALPPTEQQGHRIGQVDWILSQAEGGRYPGYLTKGNVKGVNELEAFALPNKAEDLRRRLNREETMHGTERAALGGSQTFENLANAGAGPGGLPGAMGMVTSAVHGNPVGFVRNAADMAAAFLRGETEKQRLAITQALLARDPASAQSLAARIADYEARRKQGLRTYGP